MEIQWDDQSGEAVARLQDLLRFDTTNPPGNERALVQHLADGLRSEGLEARVLVSGPERANLVVRLAQQGSVIATLPFQFLQLDALAGPDRMQLVIVVKVVQLATLGHVEHHVMGFIPRSKYANLGFAVAGWRHREIRFSGVGLQGTATPEVVHLAPGEDW